MKTLEWILNDLGGERRIHFSLDRFKLALQHLDNPQKELLTFIVGGTNGKGSTSLYFSAGLIEAGFKVVTYLSPHLQSPTERILLNLMPISEEELTALASEYHLVAKRYELTYFEFFTLLCFVFALRQGVDFLILEVGMGGRLDATNVTDPLACALTSIDLDHQAFLGNTKEEILQEKIAILNSEGLLFTSIKDANLLEIVEKKCAELDAIYYYTKELEVTPKEVTYEFQSFEVSKTLFKISCPLVGFQENVALAFLMLRILFPRFKAELFQRAFSKVAYPGRFEIVQDSPRVILSGDHNLAGIANFIKTKNEIDAATYAIIAGYSPDKPFLEMSNLLRSISHNFQVVTVPKFAKAMPASYQRLHPSEAHPRTIIEKTISHLGKQETLLVTGSLYLIGEVRSLWKSKVSFWKDAPEKRQPIYPLQDGPNWGLSRGEATGQTPAL